MTNEDYNSFTIEVDYISGKTDPIEFFKAISELIESFKKLDSDMLEPVNDELSTVYALESISEGSLKTKVTGFLKSIDDEALKSGDWKKLLGCYLSKGKNIVLEFLEKSDNIEKKEDLAELSENIIALAPYDNSIISHYRPISVSALFLSIYSVVNSISALETVDNVYIEIEGKRRILKKDLLIRDDLLESLKTGEKISTFSDMILLIKKPDYIGKSRWEFKYENRSISASLEDYEWLDSFRRGVVVLIPGDAIKANVEITTFYNEYNEVIDTTYKIKKVIKKMSPYSAKSLPLFNDEDNTKEEK